MGVDLDPRPAWRAVAASVAGTSHAASGLPCADACRVEVLETGAGSSVLVAAVADGAGTSEHAPEGARLAVGAVFEQARRWAGRRRPTSLAERHTARSRRPARPRLPLSGFTRRQVLQWTRAARRNIEREARSRRLPSREFSCTLLVALVDDGSAVFFQVGDGVIVYRGAGGRYVPALWPQSGEYANCTWFVTDDEVVDRVEWTVAECVDEIALLSDGLQGLALRLGDREAHGPFFEPMFERLRAETAGESEELREGLVRFLDSPAVNQRTDDDKTLVLATRVPVAAPVGAEA